MFSPLSLEEEQVLAEKIQEGSVEARNELVLHNLGYIYGVANRVSERRNFDWDLREELISEGLICALECAGKFEPKGYKFISYLGKQTNTMLMVEVKIMREISGS
jgi:DNA-directed RNA polymerase sigma subunit (sigma70/sigma32)